MNSYFLLRAGLHPAQLEINENILEKLWTFGKSFAASIKGKLGNLVYWGTRKVGEVADSLEYTAKELLRTFGLKEGRESFIFEWSEGAELIRALGVSSAKPLEDLGRGAGEVLVKDILSYSQDEEIRMEQLLALTMFLESMDAPRLVDLLRSKITPKLVDLPDKELSVVGYWFLRTILDHLYGRRDYKKVEGEPVNSVVSPTVQKDIRKLRDAFGVAVFGDKTIGDVPSFTGFGVGRNTKIRGKEDIRRYFSWIRKYDYGYAFWVGINKEAKIDFILREDEYRLNGGAVDLTFTQLCIVLDARRRRTLYFVCNELCFGESGAARNYQREPQIPTNSYELVVFGPEAEGIRKAAKGKIASGFVFGGFYVIGVDGDIMTISAF